MYIIIFRKKNLLLQEHQTEQTIYIVYPCQFILYCFCLLYGMCGVLYFRVIEEKGCIFYDRRYFLFGFSHNILKHKHHTHGREGCYLIIFMIRYILIYYFFIIFRFIYIFLYHHITDGWLRLNRCEFSLVFEIKLNYRNVG